MLQATISTSGVGTVGTSADAQPLSTSIGELSLGISSVSAGDVVMTGDELAAAEGCDNPQSLNIGGSNSPQHPTTEGPHSPQSSMLDEGIASTMIVDTPTRGGSNNPHSNQEFNNFSTTTLAQAVAVQEDNTCVPEEISLSSQVA